MRKVEGPSFEREVKRDGRTIKQAVARITKRYLSRPDGHALRCRLNDETWYEKREGDQEERILEEHRKPLLKLNGPRLLRWKLSKPRQPQGAELTAGHSRRPTLRLFVGHPPSPTIKTEDNILEADVAITPLPERMNELKYEAESPRPIKLEPV